MMKTTTRESAHLAVKAIRKMALVAVRVELAVVRVVREKSSTHSMGIPAYAGMTTRGRCNTPLFLLPSLRA
jgi:hypothetical protein